MHVIEWLLNHGASVNLEDGYGDSPMHYACFCGHLDAVKMLLKLGGNPLLVSKDGKTPLDSANEEGHTQVAEHLREWVASHPECQKAADEKRAAAPPAAPGAPPKAPAPPSSGAGKVAGLDFSTGVIIEGELHKKRANRMVRWRKKYYVLSQTYQAMFFWTGSRTMQEGVIKKVRFQTFLAVHHHTDKKEGRRFDVKVITGRTMELLANTPEEAALWVSTIKRHLGHIMAILRIQTAWRAFKAFRRLRAMLRERSEAVQRLQMQQLVLPAGLTMDADGVIMEGVLKKKNSKMLHSLMSAYRTRYFVLNVKDGQLYYFESKAKRQAGTLPTSIPFLSFYAVGAPRNPQTGKLGKKFHLKVVSGRVYVFMARTVEEVDTWLQALQAVLPRENVAAIKIQKTVRMYLAKLETARIRQARKEVLKNKARELGRTEEEVLAATVRIQSAQRMRRERIKYLKAKKLREEQEAQARAVKEKRVWLKGGRKARMNGMEGKEVEVDTATKGRLGRLAALKAKKEAAAKAKAAAEAAAAKAKEEAAAAAAAASAGGAASGAGVDDLADVDLSDLPIVDEAGDLWEGHKDADSGDMFYCNTTTGDSVWDRPVTTVGTVKYPYTAAQDDEGDTFYINAGKDGATQWEEPPAWALHNRVWVAKNVKDAKEGVYEWRQEKDEDGDAFYTHIPTGRTQWAQPPGWEEHLAYVAEHGEGTGVVTGGDDGNWEKMEDPETGRAYWYNTVTGQRTFNDPTGMGVAGMVTEGDVDSDDEEGEGDEDASKAANPWSQVLDEESGSYFWYNSETGESQWHEPGTEAVEAANPHEVLTFSSFINATLEAAGVEAPGIPLDLAAEPPALLTALRDGIVLTKVLNALRPDSVDERVLNLEAVPGEEVTDDAGAVTHPARENLQLVLSTAAAGGVDLPKEGVVPAVATAVESGDAETTIDTVWSLWRHTLLSSINVRKNNDLVVLLKPGEEVKDLAGVQPTAMLLRWMNYQLKAAGSHREVKDWGEELKDAVALSIILRQVASEYSEGLPAGEDAAVAASEADVEALANEILSASFGVGVPAWFSSGAITGGIPRTQIAFVAMLFAASPCLTRSDAESTGSSVAEELAEMAEDLDEEGTREVRMLRQWIGSLAVPGLTITDLVADMRDGSVLLRIMEAVEPGIVNWRRAHKNPKDNRYRRVENGNYIIKLASAMEFHLVNVGGLDIVDGRAKQILSLLWQLMRFHTFKVLSQVAFDGFGAEESDILAWANGRVVESCGDASAAISSFRDSSLSNGVYLLHLVSSVRPVINWGLVTEGVSDVEKEQNVKYLISAARKIGTSVFCTWEDLVEVKPRMVMLFCASIMSQHIAAQRSAGLMDGEDEEDDWEDDGQGWDDAGAAAAEA